MSGLRLAEHIVTGDIGAHDYEGSIELKTFGWIRFMKPNFIQSLFERKYEIIWNLIKIFLYRLPVCLIALENTWNSDIDTFSTILRCYVELKWSNSRIIVWQRENIHKKTVSKDARIITCFFRLCAIKNVQ